MTIKYYSAETSPYNGRAGYRVTVRVGGEQRHEFIQSKHSDMLAHQRAMQLESEWKHDARVAKAARALVPRHGERTTVIVKNFRATIHFSARKSMRKDAPKLTYCYPEFVVTYSPTPNRQKVACFRIDKYGFDAAFDAAVQKYTEVFNLTSAQKAELLSKKPSRELFTGALYDELVAKVSNEYYLPPRSAIELMLI